MMPTLQFSVVGQVIRKTANFASKDLFQANAPSGAAWRILCKALRGASVWVRQVRAFFFPVRWKGTLLKNYAISPKRKNLGFIKLNTQTASAFILGAVATLLAIFVANATTQKIFTGKPTPTAIPRDFTALKRDLAGMKLALDAGTSVDGGLVRFGDFSRSLDTLQIDLQVQEPKPRSAPIEQIVTSSKAIIQDVAEYQSIAQRAHANAIAQANALNDGKEQLYQLEPGITVQDQLDRRSKLANEEAENLEKASLDASNQCAASDEWHQLQSDYEKFHSISAQVIQELSQEERP